jgi:hypothetical protein
MPGVMGQPAPAAWNTAPVQGPQPSRMPVPAALAGGPANAAAATPRPTIRLQAPETNLAPPARLALPSPEALGIATSQPVPAAAPPLDWNMAHARMQRLGALGFRVDRLAQGQVRVTLTLPAADQRAHQIEVVADTEAAAVTAALETAEAKAAPRK